MLRNNKMPLIVKGINLMLIFILYSFSLIGQVDNIPPPPPPQIKNESHVVKDADVPTFPGGNLEMTKFLQKNIIYPQFEKEKRIFGTCYLTFLVDKDGGIANVKVLKGVSGGPGCDNEAVRVVKLMPKWIPAKKNGQAISFQYSLPIKFTLSPETNLAFGNYYRIEDYGIQVPFNNQPNISPKVITDVYHSTSYQYAYPKQSDDVNILYGIDVCEFNNDHSYKDSSLKVDYFIAVIAKMYKASAGGNLIKEEKSNSNKNYSVRQKIKISTQELGEIYITSVYFMHKDLVIRLFVFTSSDNDNKRMDDYFNSIKFD